MTQELTIDEKIMDIHCHKKNWHIAHGCLACSDFHICKSLAKEQKQVILEKIEKLGTHSSSVAKYKRVSDIRKLMGKK